MSDLAVDRPTAESDPLSPTQSINAARPYRSHRVPACDRCRKRKSRCQIDVSGQPCHFCRGRRLPCSFTATAVDRPRTLTPDRGRESSYAAPPGSEAPPMHTDTTNSQAEDQSEGTLIVGPAVAEDVHILEEYLSRRKETAKRRTRRYRTVHQMNSNPTIYLSVPRGRQGLQMAIDPGKTQLAIMEQVLGSAQDELLGLFFSHTHPYFPILDERTFYAMRGKTGRRISNALLCDIFALALPLWDRSETLKHRPYPSIEYAWNQAVAALQEDFMAPTISTVSAAVLDMLGRPVMSVTGNILTAGRTVALAHSLGLNRDPSSWAITSEEKTLRIRLWWGVLIHDHWSSFAHGTPPHVVSERHDVPISTYEHVPGNQHSAFHAFQQLCCLTRILGDVLGVVYCMPRHTNWDSAARTLRRAESALDDWQIVMLDHFDNPPEEEAPNGYCSLWLAFLSLRLLIQRVYLRAAMLSGQDAVASSEIREYRLSMLRSAAIDIVNFVMLLRERHFAEFWLSYSAHFLVSAATMLLRCNIETRDAVLAQQCTTKLLALQKTLRYACTEMRWDIAEMCLDLCDDAISKVGRAPTPSTFPSSRSNGTVTPAVDAQTSDGDASTLEGLGDRQPDVHIPTDPLEFSWELMWDSFDDPSIFT